jgi:hypothetical protein
MAQIYSFLGKYILRVIKEEIFNETYLSDKFR